ncbi:alpha/beta fold hydrolase [Nocardia pseudovaccinii]|uniref:alpha/beta fold hydrolase n=1 Tax=Nocardia pseudovaccinii TaxID=189540 RepID=UPI0007A48F96|nr:alpha/beta hydrolase [Nocardia pseudovaccinii]
MSQSASLGESHRIALSNGTILYRDRGTGPVVLFLHGTIVTGDLWRNVVPSVSAAGYRAITPDLPFGAHEIAVPGADLSAPGAAGMVTELLERLDLSDVIVVGNQFGGVVAQLLMADHPERIRGAVLAAPDCFEYFPPPTLAYLPLAGRIPGSMRLLGLATRSRFVRQLPWVFGRTAKRPIPRDIMDNNLRPCRASAAIRDDGRRMVLRVNKRVTLAVAQRLPSFEKPVLIIWAAEDKIYPRSLAHRLHAVLPNATVRLIEDSYTWIPEDQPDALARMIIEFADQTVHEPRTTPLT